MATQAEILLQNANFCDMLDSDGAMRKQAADDASDFIRLKLREAGFTRKILEPKEIAPSEYDQAVWTDKPIKIYPKETDIQPALTVPYGVLPVHFYIRPSKFIVHPQRILSPRVFKDKMELRTYRYDVKQVFTDNMVKDLQAAEDRALLAGVNTAMIAANTAMPYSGVAQWKQIAGGFSRTSVVRGSLQVMQQTPFNIPVETCLVNNITWSEHFAWGRDEAGGDYAEKTLTQGWKVTKLLGLEWLITLKRGLVGNLTQYMFGPQKFLGKSCLFTPPTMYVDVKYWMYHFFAMEEIGTTLAHTGAFGRVDYLA